MDTNPMAPQSKNHHGLTTAFAVLFVLALVALAAVSWQWNGTKRELTTATDQVHANQVKIDELNKRVSATVSTPSEDDAIIAATKAYVGAMKDEDTSTSTYKVMKKVDNFASVSVGSTASGSFAVVLKNVNDIWVVVTAGQTMIPSDQETFGIPDAVVQW